MARTKNIYTEFTHFPRPTEDFHHMPFIRNLWYVAMWSELLPNGGVFGRTILEEPIAFFRTATGALGAVEDTCPHRLAPLRLGSVSGENLRCGYHGLEIDAGGACVYNPHGNHTIPPAARIRSYPVIEKHTLIWIWMGDGTADSAQIPDFSVFRRRAARVANRPRLSSRSSKLRTHHEQLARPQPHVVSARRRSRDTSNDRRRTAHLARW